MRASTGETRASSCQHSVCSALQDAALLCRSALRRASKPVCAALEEWAQQDGSSRTEPDLRQLTAQILEFVTQLEQAVANLKQASGCSPKWVLLGCQMLARCLSRNLPQHAVTCGRVYRLAQDAAALDA